MNGHQLADLARNPLALNDETLKSLEAMLAAAPYSTIVRLLYLLNLDVLKDSSLAEQLRAAAPFFGDSTVLKQLLDYYRGLAAGQRSRHEDRTAQLLDAFLGPANEEEVLHLETPVADYVGQLMSEEGEGSDDTVTLGIPDIPDFSGFPDQPADSEVAFINEQHKPEPVHGLEEDDVDAIDAETSEGNGSASAIDESLLTETLARIFIRQRKYDHAMEIFQSLYLNFPNKSAYFADQIRYLEKLVRINKIQK